MFTATSVDGDVEGLSILRDTLADEEALKIGSRIHQVWMSGTHVAFFKGENFEALKLDESQVS